MACAAAVLLCGFATQNSQTPIAPRTGVSAGALRSLEIIVSAAPRVMYPPEAGPDAGHEAGVVAERKTGADRLYPDGVHLLLAQAGKATPLVPEFAASADANVDFDGKSVLFAGKKTAADHWQIWELELAGHKLRQVIAGDEDYLHPLYLPGRRLVYSRQTGHGLELEAALYDGTERLPLTHLGTDGAPVDVLAEDVLEDGRILFETGFPMGTVHAASSTSGASSGHPELYLVYSDGSGVESYRCDHQEAQKLGGRWGGRQLSHGSMAGDVLFTHGRTLGRFSSPLLAEASVAAPAAEYAGLAETSEGDWVVSARRTARGYFSLMELRPGTELLKPLYSQAGMNLVEPVVVASRITPLRHPTALHPWTTANLMALDVRISRDGDLATVPAEVRVETLGADGRAVALGTAPIAEDGSYFVTVPGDKPIRFALLNAQGEIVRAQRGWFWARAGEQRICVGCHSGPERAPENRIPGVLLKTTVPVNLSGDAEGQK
uniref:Hydrazine synthase alpha subunit middle domain-containing protein n=1 Tax=mine drainage metagenome TaxID=410659 RepID=E6QIJ6_9ZZZZ